MLTPDDRKRVARLKKAMTLKYGKVSFTFMVREALRSLEQDYERSK